MQTWTRADTEVCPYGVYDRFIFNDNDSVKMIGHDDVLTALNMGKFFFQSFTPSLYGLPGRIE
jgi:hypothetical protein